MPRKQGSTTPAVTRDDVARLAGVSSAAVSYVINGTKRLTPETEARVNEAISKLGYRPNRAARALRLGSSETLGIVVPDATNPFFTMVTHEVELAAARRGYSLISVNSDSIAGEQRQLENVVSRGVDGLVVCSTLAIPDMTVLDAARLPYVLLNQFDFVPDAVSVGVDLRAGAYIAVEHLAQHGHKTVGLIAGLTSQGPWEPREAGWRDAVQKLGMTAGPVLWETFTPQGGYAAGRQLIDRGELPSALFVSSDQIAKGLFKALHEKGIAVPEQVAVVAFDGTADAEFCWPPLTTVAQPVAEMAEAAIAALLSGDMTPAAQVFAPSLVRRDSCGCVDGEWPAAVR